MAELMRMSQGSHLTRHSSIKEHPAPGRLQSVCCQACLPKHWPDHCEGPALLAATTAPLVSWLVQSQSEAAQQGRAKLVWLAPEIGPDGADCTLARPAPGL